MIQLGLVHGSLEMRYIDVSSSLPIDLVPYRVSYVSRGISRACLTQP